MQNLTHIMQQALLLVMVASAPPVLVSLVIGFMISVFQAATQIQEQTLSFAPKVVAVFGTLAIAGTWIGHQFYQFTFQIYDRFPALIGR